MTEPIDTDPREGEELVPWLARVFEAVNPSDYATAAFNRERPYNGQPHTDEGTRGATLVAGLTMRDIKDCFVIGAFRSSGLPLEDYPTTLYQLDWNDLDPMAVCQNMLCVIEERMGIYPNVPPLTEDSADADIAAAQLSAKWHDHPIDDGHGHRFIWRHRHEREAAPSGDGLDSPPERLLEAAGHFGVPMSKSQARGIVARLTEGAPSHSDTEASR